jgi:DNA end-binding protein Ku
MRAIWKGAISFGLVNIPVGLYTATRGRNELKFHMLRDSDLSPIRYKRIAETDGKEVPWEHIVKGYEYEKGEYVVLTEKDFERVNVKSNQMVDIREFVDLDAIDPMFFDEPYYLAPEKGGEKAYALLRDALKESGKVGIAKVSIRTREHLAAVKPNGNALVLELMHFPDELADAKELPIPDKVQVGKKEMTMAASLIEGMSDKWDPQKYHDEYKQALLKLIEEKVAAGGKELPVEKGARPKPTKVIDLVSVLQQSLNQANKKPASKKEHARSKRRKAA